MKRKKYVIIPMFIAFALFFYNKGVYAQTISYETIDLIQAGGTNIPSVEYSFDENNIKAEVANDSELEGLFSGRLEPQTVQEKQEAAQEARANDNATLSERKEACAQVLYDGMIQLDSVIDVAEFALNKDEFKDVISDVVNSNPELFYIRNSYYAPKFTLSETDTMQIVDYCYGFYEWQTQSQNMYYPDITTIQSKCSELASFQTTILSEIITDEMSDVQKALAIHEYIILNTQYDYAAYLQYENDGLNSHFSDSDFDVYGTLMSGKAVCQGYALSYKYLLESAGVENIGFASNADHIWNTITLGADSYYVDCTWDDPTWDTLGNVKHTNFLKNETEFSNHIIIDSDRECNGTLYIDAFWQRIDSGIFYHQGKYYYMGEDGDLYQGTILNDQSMRVDAMKLTSLDLDTSSAWNCNNAAKMTLENNYIIYHNQNKLYCYDIKENKSRILYEPVLDTTDYIYGLYNMNGSILYATRTTAENSESEISYNNIEQTIHTYELPQNFFKIPVKSVEINGKDTIYLSGKMEEPTGEKLKLTATILPENASEKKVKKWTSSDKSVAVVDIYGTVKGIKPGTVTITAYSYDDESIVGTKKIKIVFDGSILDKEGNTIYYDKGTLLKNQFYTVEGSVYYLGNDGVRVTGWQTIDGTKFYFNSAGIYQIGWQKIENKQYYFDKNGVMLTGWQKIKDKSYYFSSSGILQTNWQKINGKMYYLTDSGALHIGWLSLDNHKYYFNQDGVMLTKWQMLNGKKYYFNGNGIMTTGWKTIKGKKYYFDKKGVMSTGWKTIKKKKYYFDKKGVMTKGWKTIKKKKYYFDKKGVMSTGWKTIKKKKYYFNKRGVMQKGLKVIKGISYYFAKDGHLVG